MNAAETWQRRPGLPGQASLFYFDSHFQYSAVKVLPGEYFVSGDALLIMTVLGSCIAVCLWDTHQHVGGMNHFLLPESETPEASGRYGAYAMELLVNEMFKLGAKREHLQAKIFGGAQVMHSFKTLNVGERNTQFVRQYLSTERIALVSQDVLGLYPRKLCYFPATGKAFVKRLEQVHSEKLLPQDTEKPGNAARWAQTTLGGSVDLF